MDSTARRRCDGSSQHLEPLDPSLEAIAGLDGTDARRRAGEDQIPRTQLIQPRERCDDVRHVPDHPADIGLLPQRAVDGEPDASATYVSGARGTDGGERRGAVEALGGVPGLAALLGDTL